MLLHIWLKRLRRCIESDTSKAGSLSSKAEYKLALRSSCKQDVQIGVTLHNAVLTFGTILTYQSCKGAHYHTMMGHDE